MQRVDGLPGLIPRYVQQGHLDPQVREQPEHTQIQEGVEQGAQGQRVVYLIRAVLTVPLDMCGLRHGPAAQATWLCYPGTPVSL